VRLADGYDRIYLPGEIEFDRFNDRLKMDPDYTRHLSMISMPCAMSLMSPINYKEKIKKKFLTNHGKFSTADKNLMGQ
jgi:hypothetical protein